MKYSIIILIIFLSSCNLFHSKKTNEEMLINHHPKCIIYEVEDFKDNGGWTYIVEDTIKEKFKVVKTYYNTYNYSEERNNSDSLFLEIIKRGKRIY